MIVNEHSSLKYSPRTYHNAATGELTVAFAEDFSSGGEKLTARASEGKYIHFYLNQDPVAVARLLWKECKKRNIKKLNVAGNGIYTLKNFGWTQESLNQWVYDCLKLVHQHHGFDLIVSGGQTGVDLAGGIVGEALGIPTVMTLPKKFLQRNIDHKDITQTREDILAQVDFYLPLLKI